MGTFIAVGITGLSVGALYFLLSSGLALIFGLMNVLSFAHGAFLAVAAYAGWLIMRSDTAAAGASTGDLVLSIVVATAAGAILAFATEILLIRPLYNRPAFDQLLVTTGLAFAITGILQAVWGADTRALPIPAWLNKSVSIGGAQITYDRFVIVAFAIVIYLAIEAFLRYTRHGLIVRAGVQNRDMVQALGIDVRNSFTLIFTLGGAFAGLAGSLAAIYGQSVSTNIGDNYLLYAFIVLIIGGLGSLQGALIASIVIGLLQQYVNYYVNLGLGNVFAIVLMVVVLLFRPQGIMGRKERLV
jgi:branched-chain amino acid transport system permease protein